MADLRCPRCLAVIEREFDYCPACDLPLSQSSGVDPINTIRTEGNVFRAAANPKSKIVVIGMWLIFGPALVGGVVMVVAAGDDWRYAAAPVVLTFLFYGTILLKTTKNYFKNRKSEGTGV